MITNFSEMGSNIFIRENLFEIAVCKEPDTSSRYYNVYQKSLLCRKRAHTAFQPAFIFNYYLPYNQTSTYRIRI